MVLWQNADFSIEAVFRLPENRVACQKGCIVKKLLSLCALAALAACSSTGSPEGAKAVGSWKTIGELNGGNVRVAYDTGSIKRKGDTAELRDRKIVDDPAKEGYAGLPAYKTAVGVWAFHCKNRTYRLVSLQLWDKDGKLLASHQFAASQIPPRAVVAGTPTEKQFAAACK